MTKIPARRSSIITRHFSLTILLFLLAALLFAPAGQATPHYAALQGATPQRSTRQTATITYRRVFKGSVPEFIEIKVDEQGNGTYEIRQLNEDSDAEAFDVGAMVRAKIFELAAELKNFATGDLDVHKNIADLGQKTLRYERDAEVHETSFNYTLDAAANQLMQIFEGLARQQGDLDLLEQRLKFDRLGVNDALRQFESDLDHRLLPEPEHLLPVLDRIGEDSRLVEIARTRARALAERIRNSHDQ